MDRVENILDIGGRQLSSSERQFVTTLLSELEAFQHHASKDRALMFHPLGGFQRYLIHKVTQVFPRLTSFSIGDEKNRRTVVCFKSKKRDQMSLQGLGGPRMEPSRNEYVDSPQRSVDLDASRRSTPTTVRSRESSRNRKKHDEPTMNKTPHRNKAEASSYLPKPLRSKKAATKRDQMKRSRSLQSSPLRGEPEHTDDDRRRGRSRSQSGKQPRSASLKPTGSSKRRDRTESPNFSDVDRKLRKAPIQPNVSDVSLKKRGQGLRLEGRVINGDVEDPYSCGDSESDAARVDAEAIRRESRHHKKVRADVHPSSSSEETRSSESSSEETDSEVPLPEEHFYENAADYDSVDTDERPPSYASLKRSASLKKAQRNLDRIKQSHSRKNSREEESSGEESSSEASSPPSRKPSTSRSTRSSAKKSSTLPKSTKEGPKKSSDTRKAHTLKSSASSRKKMPETTVERRREHSTPPERRREQSTPPERRREHRTPSERHKDRHTPPERRREHSTPPERRKDHSTPPLRRKEDERAKKSSTSSTKSKSHSGQRENLTEEDGRRRLKESREDHHGSRKDDLNASFSEDELHDAPSGKLPKTKVEERCEPPTTEVHSLATPPDHCEGGTQTEVSGTLPRTPKTAAPTADTPESSQAKSVGDILAAMVQSLQSQQQPTYQQPPFNPNLNTFHQHLLNQAPPPPSSIPPLPPHLIHHIYMSWLGAYYAGATGTLPPPPPFVLPNTTNPATGTPMTPLDFLPPNFLPFMNHPDEEAEKHPEEAKNGEHYYNDMYSSDPHLEEPRSSERNVEEPQERREPDYSAPRAFPIAEKVLADVDRGRQPTKSPQQPHDRESSPSTSHGRYETDTSSVVSSGWKSESGGAVSSKPGVVVYVCSQPSSRKSSVAHDSVDSDVGSATHSSDHGSQRKSRVSEVKKSKQHQAVRNRASTPHKREGEVTTQTNPPQAINPSPMHAAPIESTPTNEPLTNKTPTATGPDSSSVLQDGVVDASQEEIILSLRRAPLATIEDDADELSASLTSSAASLNASAGVVSGEPADLTSSSESEGSSIIVEMHAVTPTFENKPDEFPPPPEETSPSLPPMRDVQVPPIDESSDESSTNEETPPVVLPAHNGVGPSDGSSISEGDHEVHPSDSSYDADQSRVDDASQALKVRHNDVNNSSLRDVSDDVVMQDPQFDYYNWQPGEWNAEKYKRFVEIYNFPPKLSDIELSRYLTKYRGLRMTRVDKTLALCTLPSEDVANELLAENFPIFKTRSLRAASDKSRKKAKNKLQDSDFEKSRAGRPKTDTSAAKRMIAASLGGRATSGSKKTKNEARK